MSAPYCTYLHNIVDQRIFEHPVQSDAVILQDVLQTADTKTGGLTDRLTGGWVGGGWGRQVDRQVYLQAASGTVLCDDAGVGRVDACPYEPGQVFVLDVSHLHEGKMSRNTLTEVTSGS